MWISNFLRHVYNLSIMLDRKWKRVNEKIHISFNSFFGNVSIVRVLMS